MFDKGGAAVVCFYRKPYQMLQGGTDKCMGYVWNRRGPDRGGGSIAKIPDPFYDLAMLGGGGVGKDHRVGDAQRGIGDKSCHGQWDHTHVDGCVVAAEVRIFHRQGNRIDTRIGIDMRGVLRGGDRASVAKIPDPFDV